MTISSVFRSNRGSLGGLSPYLGESKEAAGKLISFGDSMAKQAHDGASGISNCYWGTRHWLPWFNARYGNVFECPASYSESTAEPRGYNVGIGGDTISNMLARVNVDVLSKPSAFVAFQGGTNSINGDVSYASLIADSREMFNRIIDDGRTLILSPVWARTDGIGTSYWLNPAAHVPTWLAYNQWMRDYARNTKNCVFIANSPFSTDKTTGKLLTSHTVDGVHLSPLAGYNHMLEAAAVLSPFVATAISERMLNLNEVYDATYNLYGNLIPNGIASGTAGTLANGATGVVASSWRGERTVVTAAGTGTIAMAYSKGTRLYQGNSIDTQKVLITTNGTGSAVDGNSECARFRPISTITTGLVAGAWYRGSFWANISASNNGTVPHVGTYIQCTDLTTGGKLVSSMRSTLLSRSIPDVAYGWQYFETPPIKLIGTTGVTVHLRSEINASKTATVEVEVHGVNFSRMITEPHASLIF